MARITIYSWAKTTCEAECSTALVMTGVDGWVGGWTMVYMISTQGWEVSL